MNDIRTFMKNRDIHIGVGETTDVFMDIHER